jgi:low affinity Fe/Cu permease
MKDEKPGFFERASHAVSEAAGSTPAFTVAFGIVLVWAISGPIFGFSDTWQLVINTGTTIVTFLMVFLIQRAQNKDAKAVALKLNEIVAVMQGASNHLVNAEDLGEKELDTLHSHYAHLAKLARRDGDVAASHSIEEAESRHGEKARAK